MLLTGARRAAVIRRPNRGGRTIASKYGRNAHNRVHIDIVGVKETMAALALWNKTATEEFDKRKKSVEHIVRASIQKVLETGRSNSVQIAMAGAGATQGMRAVRGAQLSRMPFKGTGMLARSIRVSADSPKAKHQSDSRRRPLQVLDVTIKGGPAIQRRAAAIINGFTQTIDERHKPWIRMLKARNLPAPMLGFSRVTPGRDFIRAGVMDASPEIEKIYAKAVNAANAKTTMRIPPISLAKGSRMTRFETVKKSAQATEVQRGIRGAKVDC